MISIHAPARDATTSSSHAVNIRQENGIVKKYDDSRIQKSRVGIQNKNSFSSEFWILQF